MERNKPTRPGGFTSSSPCSGDNRVHKLSHACESPRLRVCPACCLLFRRPYYGRAFQTGGKDDALGGVMTPGASFTRRSGCYLLVLGGPLAAVRTAQIEIGDAHVSVACKEFRKL